MNTFGYAETNVYDARCHNRRISAWQSAAPGGTNNGRMFS